MKPRHSNICPNCYRFTFYFITLDNYKKCLKCDYLEEVNNSNNKND